MLLLLLNDSPLPPKLADNPDPWTCRSITPIRRAATTICNKSKITKAIIHFEFFYFNILGKEKARGYKKDRNVLKGLLATSRKQSFETVSVSRSPYRAPSCSLNCGKLSGITPVVIASIVWLRPLWA